MCYPICFNESNANTLQQQQPTQSTSTEMMFTYEDLDKATDDFSTTNLLGKCGFGYVHKGVLQDGTEVAVKHLKDGSRQGEREFPAEIQFISRVHHRNLVSHIGYCVTESPRLLVYEFLLNKTLELFML
ncbi:unnamed protein product [Brassica napus]|uniref:non-specific serine/threonine protein kinase n=1 Tax=Brassica napus TaxID=3708 RepID=A0A816JXR2_BRANA|nr:unnamed protein product [Brassica napus]